MDSWGVTRGTLGVTGGDWRRLEALGGGYWEGTVIAEELLGDTGGPRRVTGRALGYLGAYRGYWGGMLIGYWGRHWGLLGCLAGVWWSVTGENVGGYWKCWKGPGVILGGLEEHWATLRGYWRLLGEHWRLVGKLEDGSTGKAGGVLGDTRGDPGGRGR